MTTTKLIRWLTIAVITCSGVPLWAADSPAPTVKLAEDNKALLPVTIGPQASDATKAVAGELADYLTRMSGATFEVIEGTGQSGIVVGRPADFSKLPFAVEFESGPLHREDYLLRSRGEGLYLIGATDLAVSHAVWDVLTRLGYRQYFPGQTWEIVPRQSHLSLSVDERQRPDFHARRIWYNWGLWGYNNEPYQQWCRRNRMAKGLDLNSGHAYDSIIAANQAEFDKHPEYYALFQGERKSRGGDTKFCISNPGLRQLVVDHAVRQVRANPSADSVSMDPSDGGNWCECDACARMGSVSDRVVALANDVAVAINDLGLGPKYVGMYAYNQHSAPPHVRVDPHVIPSATTAFIGGGFTFDQIVEGWQAQGATMGVYDYLSVVAWDWNLPRNSGGSRPSRAASFLPDLHKKGVRFYDAESGDCWGPCGLGYYVTSRILWDIDDAQRLDKITDEFLTDCFGTASEPMREFYRLITEDTQRRPHSDLIGRMYRQLDAAHKATDDAKVHKRIDDLTLYTRHAELYYAHADGSGSVEAVARHDYRMRKTMMVHSYGLWSRLVSQQAALTPDHPWKDETEYSAADVARMRAEGIANNAPVDPGFTSKEFSRDLVPAAEALKLPDVPAGSFPPSAQDHQQYYVWIPEGAGELDLTITVQKVWQNRLPVVNLYSPQEVTIEAVASNKNYRPDGKPYSIVLKTPHSGLHRVETLDGGDHTRIQWPKDMPVTVESGIDSPGVTSHFRGPWTLYFYVPKGTKLVGGWAARVANWAPRISGKLLNADGQEMLDFGKVEEGWFNVPVPEGQDGRLWKFSDSQGQRLLMTVPPYLARSGDELLLPSEVVKADAQP